MVDPNVIDSECSEALDKGAATCQTSFLTNRERDRQRLLSVDYVAISALLPYKGNARTHSKAQIRKIAESIRAFGFTNPILIDVNRTITAGHGRVEAAKLLKMQQVPTIRLESLTPAEVRAYAIADNRLAEDAGWDRQILKIELESLIVEDQIDISVTGFEVAEIDLVFDDKPIGDDPADCLPTEIQAVVSQRGDLWLLRPHRVLCGDARDGSCFSMLMGDRRAAVVFADPPYNVPIDGHAGGLEKTHHQTLRWLRAR